MIYLENVALLYLAVDSPFQQGTEIISIYALFETLSSKITVLSKASGGTDRSKVGYNGFSSLSKGLSDDKVKR